MSNRRIVKRAARNLRKNQTPSEKKFWELVRNRKLYGKKFLRQHPIVFKYEGKERFFIADFYCAERKLVVEIDGKIHEDQIEYDTMRTLIINKLEMKVIRIKNEVLDNIEKVANTLKPLLE